MPVILKLLGWDSSPKVFSVLTFILLLAALFHLHNYLTIGATCDEHFMVEDPSRVPVVYFIFHAMIYFFGNRFYLYRLVILLVFLITSVYLGKLVHIMTDSSWISWGVVVLIVLLLVDNDNVRLVYTSYEVFSGFFIVLSLYSLSKGALHNSKSWLSISIVALWAAILSKEIGIMLGVLIPAWLYLFRHRYRFNKVVLIYISAMLLSLIALLYRIAKISMQGGERSILELLTGLGVKLVYLYQTSCALFFARLELWNQMDQRAWAALVLSMILMLGIFILYINKQRDLLALLLFGLMHIPAVLIPFCFLDNQDMHRFQRAYIPSMGLVMAVAMAIYALHLWMNPSKRKWLPKLPGLILGIYLLVQFFFIIRFPLACEKWVYDDFRFIFERLQKPHDQDDFYIFLISDDARCGDLYDLVQNLNYFYFNDKLDHYYLHRTNFTSWITRLLFAESYQRWTHILFIPTCYDSSLLFGQQSDLSGLHYFEQMQLWSFVRYMLERRQLKDIHVIQYIGAPGRTHGVPSDRSQAYELTMGITDGSIPGLSLNNINSSLDLIAYLVSLADNPSTWSFAMDILADYGRKSYQERLIDDPLQFVDAVEPYSLLEGLLGRGSTELRFEPDGLYYRKYWNLFLGRITYKEMFVPKDLLPADEDSVKKILEKMGKMHHEVELLMRNQYNRPL